MHYNPSDLDAYLKTAELLVEQGKRSQAISVLRKACDLDPERGETFLTLGRLLREEGTWKEARDVVEHARSKGTRPLECNAELRDIYQKLAEEAASACDPAGPPPSGKPGSKTGNQ